MNFGCATAGDPAATKPPLQIRARLAAIDREYRHAQLPPAAEAEFDRLLAELETLRPATAEEPANDYAANRRRQRERWIEGPQPGERGW